jgi:hypothetical protein
MAVPDAHRRQAVGNDNTIPGLLVRDWIVDSVKFMLVGRINLSSPARAM